MIEPAADAGDLRQLHDLLLSHTPPRSQQLYRASLAASGGWQLHPASAVVWGWLNLANGAFCGSGAELVATQKGGEEGKGGGEMVANSSSGDGGGGEATTSAAAPAAAPAAAETDKPPTAADSSLTWVTLALGVMDRVAASLGLVTDVLLKFSGKADKQRDEGLIKDIREVRAGGSWSCRQSVHCLGV